MLCWEPAKHRAQADAGSCHASVESVHELWEWSVLKIMGQEDDFTRSSAVSAQLLC